MHARPVFAVSLTHARTHARTWLFRIALCRGNANSHARGDIHNTVPLITHCLCDGISLFFSRLAPIIAVSLINVRHAFEQIIIRYTTCRRKVWYGPSLLFFLDLITISFQREKERKREREWKRLAYPFRRKTLKRRRKRRTARRNTHAKLEIHYSLNCRPNAFISILITRAHLASTWKHVIIVFAWYYTLAEQEYYSSFNLPNYRYTLLILGHSWCTYKCI